MKKKQKLSYGITLINQKFKKNEFYHYFDLPNVSITLPIINNKFLIISQKRIPINSFIYEFPSGWIDRDETAINSAKRELLEETGFKTVIELKKILEFYPEVGRMNNKVYAFYTNKLVKVNNPEKGIKNKLVSKNELIKLISKKKFNNSAHIAVFYHFLFNYF